MALVYHKIFSHQDLIISSHNRMSSSQGILMFLKCGWYKLFCIINWWGIKISAQAALFAKAMLLPYPGFQAII